MTDLNLDDGQGNHASGEFYKSLLKPVNCGHGHEAKTFLEDGAVRVTCDCPKTAWAGDHKTAVEIWNMTA